MLSPAAAYFLLLGLQILALWAPPFRGRALVFVSAIIACAVVLHSERVGDDPQIAYAFGMPWVSYLATIDRLLFAIPELSFWRVGEKAGEAMSYGFGLKKLQWSAAIYFNPRGIHWNYAANGLTPTDLRPEILSRHVFVYRNTARFVVLCLGYDILHTYLLSQYGMDGRPPWNPVTIAAAAYVIFCGMQLNHLLASVTFVGLGLSRPEDWPPLFGDIRDAFTVRRVWGKFWHKLIRRTLSAYSKFAVRTLRIKNATVGASLHMIIIFFLCGVFHALPLRVMLGEEHRLPLGTVFFFSAQAGGIFIEEITIAAYTRVWGDPGTRMWPRCVGFVWVAAWFCCTLPLFLDDMFASGMMDASTMPFSVARAVGGWPLEA